MRGVQETSGRKMVQMRDIMKIMTPAMLMVVAGRAVYFSGLLAVGLIAGASFDAKSADAQTLTDALAAAYMNNPELLSERAATRAADEAVPQALANWRPKVEMSGDLARAYTRLNTRSDPDRDQMRTPRNTSLDITQPLFRGFRTIAGVDQAEHNVLAQRASLLAKEQDILLNAVSAYMSVVRDQAELNLNINNEQVLRRQLEATQDRFRVGEITRTDVSQAEARLAGATADRIQAEGNLEISRANYLNVIGEAPKDLSQPAALNDLPTQLEEAIKTALADHPDMVAKKFSELSARESVKSVRGELLPTLNLVGTLNRYWESSTNDSQLTTGSVKLDLTVPLYQKGSVMSRLREAKQEAGQSRINLVDQQRDTTEATTKAWESLQTAQARIKSFTAQIKAAEIALEGVQREAAVGSRTVLDVLDAEQELLDAKVNLVRAQRDEVVASYELKEAVGGLTARKLKLAVDYYDPTGHYNEVRGKWFGYSSSGENAPVTKK